MAKIAKKINGIISIVGPSGLTSFNGRTAAAVVFTLADLPALTGYVSLPGVVSATDTPFTAIQKLDGNIKASTGKQIGVIISDDFTRTTLGGNYTQVGAIGVAITANKLALSGAGSYATHVLRNDWYVNLKTWDIEADFVIDSAGGGLAIILKGAIASSYFKIDNTGKLFIDYDYPTLTNAANSGTSLVSFATGETIHVKVSRNYNSVTLTAYNTTTPSNQVAVTANADLSTTGFTFGTVARIAFAQLGGSNTVDNFVYSSKIQEGAEIAVVHDSLGDGYNAGASGLEWINHLASTLNIRVEKLGTSGNKTSDSINSLPELGLLKPKYTLLSIGINDTTGGVSLATFQANIITILNYCRSIGSIPLFTTVPVTTGSSTVIDTYNAWFTGTVQGLWGIQVIDITTYLKDGGTSLAAKFSSDGTHWPYNGHAGVGALVANALTFRFPRQRISFQEDGYNVNVGTTNNTTPVKHTSSVYKGVFLGDGNYLYNELIAGQEGLSLATNRVMLLNGSAASNSQLLPCWKANISNVGDGFSLWRAPAINGVITEVVQFSAKGNSAGFSNFGFNRAGNVGNYTVDISNPRDGETTLRLNALTTPQFAFMELAIGGTQVSYFTPQAGICLNSNNNATAGRGSIYLGFNFPYSQATNILYQAVGTAPTVAQINTQGFVQYAHNRGGVAGKAGLSLLTADATPHIFADRVGLGTLSPNSYLTTNGGNHLAPAFNFNLLQSTSASGSGTVITLAFATQAQSNYIVGQTLTLTEFLPIAYNGDWVVASVSQTGVTLTGTATGTVTTLGKIGALTNTPIRGSIEYNGIRLFQTPASLIRQTVAWLSDLSTRSSLRSSATTLTLGSTARSYFFGGTTAATWTLPVIASSFNAEYYIKNTGTANITLVTQGADLMYTTSAVASLIIPPGIAFILQNDGLYWEVM